MKDLRYFLVMILAAILAAGLGLSCDDDDDDDDAVADDDDSADDDDDASDDDAADDDDDDDYTDPFEQAEANPGTWVWVPVDGAICRDGSDTGFGLRLQVGATKLAIFLQGGGACYSPSSCEDNPAFFGADDLPGWASGVGEVGIFNDENDANPVKDWNFVFIPYCTGDVHSGSYLDAPVPGLEDRQQFAGFANVAADLAVIQPYFADAEEVFFTGSSAGGFGTMTNYPQVAEAFTPTVVNMLDDSGPLPEDDEVLAPCYQLLLNFIFDFSDAIDAGCPDCIELDGDGFAGWYTWLAETYPTAVFGLFSSYQDETIRDFFGLGQDNCNGDSPIPGPTFEAGLKSLRDDIMIPSGRWSSYYINGTSHTSITDDSTYFGTEVDSTKLTDWIADIIGGTVSQVTE